MPKSQQAKKEVTVLAEAIGPDYRGKLECSSKEVKGDTRSTGGL